MTVSARLGSRRRLSLLVVADDAGDPVEERADLDVHAGVLSGLDEFLKQRKSVSSCNQLTLGCNYIVGLSIRAKPNNKQPTVVDGEEWISDIACTVIAALIPHAELLLRDGHVLARKELLAVERRERRLQERKG